jgi:hypothetical protein
MTLNKRASRIGWNYFKEPYETRKHRQKFIRFLESNILNSSRMAKRYAAFFESVLDRADRSYTKQNRWLREFFEDEPEWENRLKAWIREINQETAMDEDA